MGFVPNGRMSRKVENEENTKSIETIQRFILGASYSGVSAENDTYL